MIFTVFSANIYIPNGLCNILDTLTFQVMAAQEVQNPSSALSAGAVKYANCIPAEV